MHAIITVIGKDTVGIIAGVSSVLSRNHINVRDISQSVLKEYFAMVMLVDLSSASTTFADIQKQLEAAGQSMGISIRIQHEDVFEAMHRI
jgi:ACT domain-containing protein